MIFRFSVFVGPTIVRQIADMVTMAGYANVVAGTERVYFDAPGKDSTDASIAFIDTLKAKCGTSFGLKAQDLQKHF